MFGSSELKAAVEVLAFFFLLLPWLILTNRVWKKNISTREKSKLHSQREKEFYKMKMKFLTLGIACNCFDTSFSLRRPPRPNSPNNPALPDHPQLSLSNRNCSSFFIAQAIKYRREKHAEYTLEVNH